MHPQHLPFQWPFSVSHTIQNLPNHETIQAREADRVQTPVITSHYSLIEPCRLTVPRIRNLPNSASQIYHKP